MARKPARPALYVIDSTPWTSVVRCTLCSWRGFGDGKRSAYRQIATHLENAHDEYKAAGQARRSSRRHFTDDVLAGDASLRESA